jgi:hypothetical protein
VDLNARRAARTEAENTPHEVVLGVDEDGKEQVFKLKPSLPLEITDLLNVGQFRQAMELLLVDPADWRRMCAAGVDADDLLAMIDLYGVVLGESQASGSSSTSGGRSSRPTSPTTTPASPRSRKSATAPTPPVPAASTP